MPVALVTRRFCRRCMSVRASSSICTRIGTSRSPALNLARLASTSPMVATRTVSAIVSGATPRRAASSSFGTTRSSGRSSERVGGDVREAGHLAQRAFELAHRVVQRSPSCDSIENDSSRSPRSLTYQARVSGTSASLSEMIALIVFCGSARSVLGDELHEQRRLADLAAAGRRAAAEHEDARHLRDGPERLRPSGRWWRACPRASRPAAARPRRRRARCPRRA